MSATQRLNQDRKRAKRDETRRESEGKIREISRRPYHARAASIIAPINKRARIFGGVIAFKYRAAKVSCATNKGDYYVGEYAAFHSRLDTGPGISARAFVEFPFRQTFSRQILITRSSPKRSSRGSVIASGFNTE